MQFIFIYRLFIEIFMTTSFFFCIYGMITSTFLGWYNSDYQLHFIRIGIFLTILLIDNKILNHQSKTNSPIKKERFYLIFQTLIINIFILNIILEYVKILILSLN